MSKQTQRQYGFTLIELSIVLIIIGFIIAGVAAGQSLAKQASLKSVISDINYYMVTFNTFKSQYNSLPGDIANATQFWPTSGNGNGDGMIQYLETVPGNGPEWLRAWDHLSRAGLLQNNITYTGSFNPGSTTPASKVANLHYMVGYEAGPLYGNKLSNFLITTGGLSSVDAYVIDQKLDDGQAATGNILGLAPNPYLAGHCVTDIWTAPTASYIMSDPNNYSDCRLYIFLP